MRKAVGFRCFIHGDHGQVGQFVSPLEPGITLQLRLQPFPKYASLMTLRFNVRFFKGSKNLHHVSANLHLGSRHIDWINIEKVVLEGEDGSVVPKFLTEGDPLFHDRVREGQYHKVSIKLSPAKVHAAGFLANKNFGPQTSGMTLARNIILKSFEDGLLELYVRGSDAPDYITELHTLLQAEENNLLAKWYPKHPDKAFIQLGDYPDSESRPFIPMLARPTFIDMAEYVTFLGFARIGEHEHEKSVCDQLSKEISYLRCLTIPHADDRRYFGFLKLPDGSSARIEPGAVMRIHFLEGDDDDELIPWHGRATASPMPFCPPDQTSILLSRPYDEDNGKWERLDNEIEAVQLDQFTSGDSVRQVLDVIPGRPVRVTLLFSETPFKRSINALRALQQDPTLEPILLGNDLLHLRVYDIFGGTDVKNEDVVQAGQFNKEQQDALQQLRHIPGGIATIQGPPGTGKTHFLLHTLTALVQTGKQAMIVSSSNVFVDGIARKANEMLKDKHLPGKFVVRVHCIGTEEEIARLPAEQARPKPNKLPAFLNDSPLDPIIEDMSIFKTTMEFYAAQTRRVSGIADRRVRLIEISLGRRMLQFAGLLTPAIEGVDISKYKGFKSYFQQYMEGEALDDDMVYFNAEARTLCNDVLKDASVVVCTLHNTGANSLRYNFRPAVIMIDEAAKVLESDLWPSLAWYAPNAFLLLGHQKQLRPVVLSTRKENPFARQLSLSFFSRMQIAGLMDLTFLEQHRMCPEISAIVNDVFYNNELRDSKEASVRHPISTALASWNKSQFDISSPVVFLDNKNGEAIKDSTSSSFNISNIMIVMALVEDLLKDEVIDAKDITILTPYQAQFARYISCLDRLGESCRGLGVEKVSAFKTDSFQGAEAAVVIIDLVITSKAGFLSEANRLNVALSRAKYGQYVVGSSTIMNAQDVGKWIPRVFSHLTRHKAHRKPRMGGVQCCDV